jgi:hypothetical protein
MYPDYYRPTVDDEQVDSIIKNFRYDRNKSFFDNRNSYSGNGITFKVNFNFIAILLAITVVICVLIKK